MSADWPVVTLKEAGISLIDCDHKTPKEQSVGLPYVGIPQLKDGRVLLAGARLISEEDFHHWRRKAKPMPDDVILSRRCNPGVMAYVPINLDIALGQNLVLLRSDGEKVYPPFLRWITQGSNWWLQVNKYINVGAVFESLKCADIPKFEFRLPPMKVQVKIAKTLGDLDNKIELNRQTNQTLEDIAQTIFKSWFVDFEPTRAKMTAKEADQDPELAAMAAISGKPITELDQLAPEKYQVLKTTAALFPDELVDSELGEIPEGWEVNAMEDLVDIGSAKRIFSKEYIGEGVPFYRGKEVTILSGGKNITPEIFISESRYNELKEKSGVPKENDILITSVGTIGNTYLVHKEDKFYFKDGNLTWIKAYKKFEIPYFLKIWFDGPFGKRSIEEIKIGSTQQAITITSINNLQLVAPSEDLHEIFNSLMKSNFNKRNTNLQQTKVLTDLRDSLLPKLLSGEIKPNPINQ